MRIRLRCLMRVEEETYGFRNFNMRSARLRMWLNAFLATVLVTSLVMRQHTEHVGWIANGSKIQRNSFMSDDGRGEATHMRCTPLARLLGISVSSRPPQRHSTSTSRPSSVVFQQSQVPCSSVPHSASNTGRGSDPSSAG